MPVIIPAALPATEVLTNEQIFVMHEQRAREQDIRPLKLAIVNLMPTKIVTETQLLRLISNTALQVEVDLIRMASHVSKNVSEEHLQTFYKDFEEIKHNKYDGMIVTGAPVEHMSFQEVNYWDELKLILILQIKMYFPPCLSAGGPRRRCITITVCLNMLCRKSGSACLNTRWYSGVRL